MIRSRPGHRTRPREEHRVEVIQTPVPEGGLRPGKSRNSAISILQFQLRLAKAFSWPERNPGHWGVRKMVAWSASYSDGHSIQGALLACLAQLNVTVLKNHIGSRQRARQMEYLLLGFPSPELLLISLWGHFSSRDEVQSQEWLWFLLSPGVQPAVREYTKAESKQMWGFAIWGIERERLASS